jgi:hypothetical protein
VTKAGLGNWGLSWLAIPALAALVLWVEGRSPHETSRWLSLSPDTAQYVAMAEGRPAEVPFRHRLLVPWIAGFLPLEPLDALRWITWACLAASYAGILRLLAGRGIPRSATLLAFLASLAATRNLYLVQNPFGTDAFGLLAMVAMLIFFVEDRPLAFGAVTPIGILAREETLFAAPALLFAGRWRSGALVVLVALAAYSIPRLGPGAMTALPLGYAPVGDWHFWAKIYFAMGPLWPLMLIGFGLSGRLRIRGLGLYVASVLGGALLSTYYAADTLRVFLPVLPVAALLAGVAFQAMARAPVLCVAWAALCCASGALSMPSVAFPSPAAGLVELEDWYRDLRVPLALVHGAVVALAAGSLWVLRQEIREGFLEVRRLRPRGGVGGRP